MIRAWRIVREGRAADAFSGEGARQYGGRWNSPGVSVVYTSAHQSLAALEMLVHLQPRISLRFVVFPVEFEDHLVEHLRDDALTAHWRVEPPGSATMEIGDAWARTSRAAVLAVPSVIVPLETNYLLNPLHPAFGRINIEKPFDFSFDPRLLE
jgi:RES domain-containing protein